MNPDADVGPESDPESDPDRPVWDVFRGETLEVFRALGLDELRAGLARGDLHDEDLVRPAGSSAPWSRLADLPALAVSPPAVGRPPVETGPILPPEPGREVLEPGRRTDPEIEDTDLLFHPVAPMEEPPGFAPDDEDDADDESPGPLDEDEEAAEFTLSRGSATQIEELDLAAMVDVAFQMVLFFMVTATTVLYKTLEVPRTPPQSPPGAVAQGQPKKTVEDLENDYILVEVDPQGRIQVDHEPSPPGDLAARLRAAREATGRTAMLLSADLATPHRNAVLAYDAANEIGLRIAIAKPAGG